MVTTSPVPESSQVPAGPRRASRHKLFIIIAAVVVVLGLLGYLYSAYGLPGTDSAPTNSQTKKINGSAQQKSTTGVSAQQEPPTQPVASPSTQINESTDLVTLSLHADSGSEPVNTVQTQISYPAESLQLESVIAGTAYPQEVATDTRTAGFVKIARAVSGQTELRGDQVVVKLTFKPLKPVDVASLVKVDQDQSYLVTSTDNRNLIGTSSASLSLRR